MTVKMLPGGMYHLRVTAEGATAEHFIKDARIRESESEYVLYCPECPALTIVRKGIGTEEERNVIAALRDGYPVLAVTEKQIGLDPFTLAKEDGDKRIPSTIPKDSAARRDLAISLRDG